MKGRHVDVHVVSVASQDHITSYVLHCTATGSDLLGDTLCTPHDTQHMCRPRESATRRNWESILKARCLHRLGSERWMASPADVTSHVYQLVVASPVNVTE
ncbi:hypothetical protein J6590_056386 [Homalodisca vitripennis]|nr:hypothetical protein J6590_056386 [Homalodisca vitripennis]